MADTPHMVGHAKDAAHLVKDAFVRGYERVTGSHANDPIEHQRPKAEESQASRYYCNNEGDTPSSAAIKNLIM